MVVGTMLHSNMLQLTPKKSDEELQGVKFSEGLPGQSSISTN